MHIKTDPSILYFGTPAVLISTANKDGIYNLASMSWAFWLRWRCIFGLSAKSKTTQNMIPTGECVLNLASVDEVGAVNRLALRTGSDPVPESKMLKEYRYESDKFMISELTPMTSETVMAPLVQQCPIQLEAVGEAIHGIAEEDPGQSGNLVCIEVRMHRGHIEESILTNREHNRIDPDKWRPLVMGFRPFYGLGSLLQTSVIGQIPESLYQSPDVDRVHNGKE